MTIDATAFPLDLIPVGAFIRVSDEDQVRGDSPATHLDRAQDYAPENGLRLVEVYQLDGVSGETTINLPETRKMLYDAKTGRIKAVLVTRVDRLGRDAFELMAIERELKAYGASIISIYENIDTSTVEGMNRFIDICREAQYYRGRLSNSVLGGLQQRRKRGQVVASKVPYGYRKVGRKMEIDPVEGPIRQEMYQLFLKHKKLMPVIKELKKRGYKTRKLNITKPGSTVSRGQIDFDIQHVKAILLDTTAMGIYYSGKTRSKSRGKIRIKLPKEEWVSIPVDPLITLADYEETYELLMKQPKQNRATVHVFSGLLTCGCGTKMYVRHTERKLSSSKLLTYYCRECRNKIHSDALDQLVGGLITGFCLDHLPPDAELAPEPQGASIPDQIAAIDTICTDLIQQQERLIDLVQDGLLNKAKFQERNQPLATQLESLRAEKQRLEFTQAETERETSRAVHVIESGLGRTMEWGSLTPEHKSLLVRDFIKRMILTPSKLEITPIFMPQGLLLGALCKESTTASPRPLFAQLATMIVNRPDLSSEPRIRWGAFIAAARAERGLELDVVAADLGAKAWELNCWEQRIKAPPIKLIPRIIEWLGYIPWPMTPYAAKTMSERVKLSRELRGHSVRSMQKIFNIPDSSLHNCELRNKFFPEIIQKLIKALEIPLDRIGESWVLVMAFMLASVRAIHHPTLRPFGSMILG